jgi:hypothetical protein
MSLATESFMADEAGDHSKAEAAENARAALVPSKLKAEESVLRAEIAGAIAARESVARLIRSDAGDLPLQRNEEIVATFTRTFDDDVWRAEQQLANNLEEQAQLGSK